MTKNWAQIRSILKTQGQAPGVFLSLITGEGIIEHANSRMLKTFHLKNPRETENNFFDLIHPAYRHSFRSALQACGINGNINDSELSLKNGYYHSMKWHISRLMAPESRSPRYLCIGYQVETGVNKNGKPVYPGLKHYQEIINGLNEVRRGSSRQPDR